MAYCFKNQSQISYANFFLIFINPLIEVPLNFGLGFDLNVGGTQNSAGAGPIVRLYFSRVNGIIVKLYANFGDNVGDGGLLKVSYFQNISKKEKANFGLCYYICNIDEHNEYYSSF